VSACQTSFDVRIDSHLAPELVPQLMVHELLVYQQLHHFKLVSEEGLYAVSREIRNQDPGSRLSNDELITLLTRAGFGGKPPYIDLVALAKLAENAGPKVKATPETNKLAQIMICESYRRNTSRSFSTEAVLCSVVDLQPADEELVKSIVLKETEDYWISRLTRYKGWLDAACNQQYRDYPLCNGGRWAEPGY
jgi:hypothetical protein